MISLQRGETFYLLTPMPDFPVKGPVSQPLKSSKDVNNLLHTLRCASAVDLEVPFNG